MKISKPLGIAIWGLGSHVWKNILPAISASDVVELVGVHTRNTTKAERVISNFGGKFWSTTEHMLSDPLVDIVYVATPTGLHFEHGMMVLGANKNLLCEKSLTHDSSKSLCLINCAKSKDLIILEAFMYLYHPQFLTALNIVTNPDFGKILHISSNFGIPRIPKSSFRTSKKLGGGAFLDVGCYPISIAVSLVQKLPKVLQFIKTKDIMDDIDISGVATLFFPSNITAHLGWGYYRAYRAELMVWGEKQSFYVNYIFSKPDTYESQVLLSDKYGNIVPIIINPANSFVEMFKVLKLSFTSENERKRLWNLATLQAKTMGLFQDDRL
ncbi:MAG: Gfo/Idh/MocA family oxidoreductase [Coxiellaceae bacterium]|jgi:NDP-hexose-3-ketoreductase|nr:Gfo/Idh/MocA family oxidoreductase [Coxiellaceae bacterium]